MVACGRVATLFLEEFAPRGVEEAPAELVAERVPHDRIHADEPRREMADRKELHELHIDQLRARGERERIAVAAHVDRRAVASIEARKAAGRDDGGLRRDAEGLAARDMHGVRADAGALRERELGHEQIADAPDLRRAVQLRAQGLRDGGTGVHEIDVHAARPVVARRLHLADMAVLARPADAPAIELANALGRLFAEQTRKRLVAKSASALRRG